MIAVITKYSIKIASPSGIVALNVVRVISLLGPKGVVMGPCGGKGEINTFPIIPAP